MNVNDVWRLIAEDNDEWVLTEETERRYNGDVDAYVRDHYRIDPRSQDQA